MRSPPVILRGNNPEDRMSALGQKQTPPHVRVMSPLPPKADVADPAVRRSCRWPNQSAR
jgi:hypothetical protein